jgi:hypothetical protein
MRRFPAALLVLSLLLAGLPSACTPQPVPPAIEVITHPDGPLFVGDQVSLEVLRPDSLSEADQTVEVSFDGRTLGTAAFGAYGIAGRQQATLWWVWDTRDLHAGLYDLTFKLDPGGQTWERSIRLEPASQVPAPEPDAHWVTTTTPCCTYYYITGTDGERDINTLTHTAQAESERVISQLGAATQQPIPVFLVPRVIGHGGFTWGAVYVSYLDENYIGNEMGILFHHEFVHYYDAAVGGTFLPALFQEGLAVYLSGGHFKPEALEPRAAALLDLGWYIPLPDLADDFYTHQHDISYLEAGSLVMYLVETYGWGAFNEFYRTIPKPDGNGEAAAIDAALHEHFSLSFAELEREYRDHLLRQAIPAEERTDLELTVGFFDTARRYQSTFDPSAYFLTAWLPDGMEMVQRGIVADFLRRPQMPANRLLEWLLMQSEGELFHRNYPAASRSLEWTNDLIDLFDR